MDDNEKEVNYKYIKKFTDDISKANRLLKEWNEGMESFTKNLSEDVKLKLKKVNYIQFQFASQFLAQFSACAPPSLQLKPIPVLNKGIEGQYASKDIVDFLYQLSNGDIKNLSELAKFSYKIIYKPKECLGTVILAVEKIHESLRKYFDLLTYPHFTKWYDELTWTDFNTLRLKEVRAVFLEHEFKKDLPIILIKGKTIYRVGESFSFFKRLFNGKKINIDSPYFDDELVINNSLPLIYVTEDEKKYNDMENLYKNLNAMKINSKELNIIDKYSESAEWLRTVFMCIGQKEVSANPKSIKPYKADHDEEIKKFLRICCTVKKEQEIKKEELYLAYKEYFEHCYPENECIGMIMFGKKVLSIKQGSVTSSHTNYSRKERKRLFKGIALKENYSERYKDEPVHRTVVTEKDKFEILLNKLVDEAFKDVQLNKTRVKGTVDININNNF